MEKSEEQKGWEKMMESGTYPPTAPQLQKGKSQQMGVGKPSTQSELNSAVQKGSSGHI